MTGSRICGWLLAFVGIAGLTSLGASDAQAEPQDGPLVLNARSRVETAPGSGRYHAVTRPLEWDPAKTAVIICDMWDEHWCRGASRRVAEMAPRMNQVVAAARQRGVLVIHCPSACMDYYKDTPQRKRAQQAPAVEAKRPLQPWCRLDPQREAPLPIDDSDGGCDCQPQCKTTYPWRRQIETIEIADDDAITDSAEAYYLMRQRGIENVIVMGVHTNMCVLGRPFSIRQMVYQGQNVVLMRDMTDTMYNSRSKPFVSHFTGTDLVVEHIERHWCPTITSVDFIGGTQFRFSADKRPHLAIVAAEDEYKTEQTLPDFAARRLGKDFRVSLVFSSSKNLHDLPGIEVLKEADAALLSIRRRTPPKGQLDVVRKFVADGKPLVAIRTSSHAFQTRGSDPPAGHDQWADFDREVLGGKYTGHYSSTGPRTKVWAAPGAADHPIMTGVPNGEFQVRSWLYKYEPLADSTRLLMHGRVGDDGPQQPAAWVNKPAAGGRVFYTMLGHPDEFQMPQFQRLLLNAVYWAAGLPVPKQVDLARTEQDYENWTAMQVPGTWDEHSQGALSEYDGFAWYRCLVKLPASWKGQDLELFVEQVDNSHEAYVNGVKVGAAGTFPPNYTSGLEQSNRYRVEGKLLSVDKLNAIAIRVYDNDGRGGFKGTAPALFNERMAINLAGEWEFRTGDDLAWAKGPLDGPAEGPFVFAKVDRAAEIIPRVISSTAKMEGALSPEESFKKFKVADDLELEQVLAEPVIQQPLSISFDERGRMWVVQYIQYPTPAGLKMVSRDNFWRAVYDRVPPPPPHHFPGKDKITIHEDTNGDGRFDTHKTFVEGLNITTAAAPGRGGVWVLNPPYLLFYPDADGDDVPDGDPEVHLEGFGLEDTHSVANSLRWGPDGWLYAAQGSTVTAAIKRPGFDKTPVNSMGQLIWRYHPETRRYEIFAEGGGNAFGVEIDAKGRIFSGHNGGDTRGFHYVQGGYLQKGFAKHGPLSNPYAFGYFPAMKHHSAARFTHTFLIYEGDGLLPHYRGKLFGVEPLQGQVVLSQIERDTSSFKTKDLSRPITSDDGWFRPVDIKDGPDGAIYVADWYDGQVNHYRNNEGKVHPESGRVYRLKVKGAGPAAPLNLAALSSAELVEMLAHESRWRRATALRLLGDRKDQSVLPQLEEILANQTGQFALEALWAVNLVGGLSEGIALQTLEHKDPHVRLWTARLLCDEKTVSRQVADRLAEMAAADPDVEVRSQLACSARRLPAEDALRVVRGLITRSEDIGDVHLPLLIWWTIESKCGSDPQAVLTMLQDKALWDLPMMQQLLQRLMKRYAQAGTRQDLLLCARLLDLAPRPEHAKRLMAGFEEAFQGRSLAGLPDELVAALARSGGGSLALRVRQGNQAAVSEALAILANPQADKAQRTELARLFGETRQAESVPVLLNVLRSSRENDLQQAALTALQTYDEARIGSEVLGLYPRLPLEARSVAETLLTSRVNWSKQLLAAVDSGVVAADEIPLPAVRKLLLHDDEAIAAAVGKHWGEVKGASTEEIRQEVDRMVHVVSSGYGSPYRGKKLYTEHCGKCHVLFGEGGQIGPDLTTFKRDDLPNMMLHVVNPSAEIREGFETYVVLTDDGRQLNGFLADQDNRVVVLRGQDGQNVTLARDEIEVMKSIGVSIMPEGLLKNLTEDQVRDLFAYLRSTQPLND